MSSSILECGGALKPEVVLSTAHKSGRFPASNVLILGEEDTYLDPGKKLSNFWLADTRNVTGQGFTMKVDNCRRRIEGVRIKNMGKGLNTSSIVAKSVFDSGNLFFEAEFS